MAEDQPWKDKGMKKAEWLTEEVAKAVGAGKPWKCETVDFSDPDRPPTCIEVDFPIIPINQIAAIEGNAGKPIYQMSKWWARRRSSVFRAMLLAAAIKAPDEPSEAAKLVWNAYYGNHQKKKAFKDLKVADIFMGGGTTIVEGSRLGMQMYGNDLNPVAWFIVKNEMAQVDKDEVEALLANIETEVKPQIMPFYTCDCPRGHKGKWTRVSTGEIMGDDFNPLVLTPEQRKNYQYEGPEIIYVFWAKHGPCQVTGCGHRTPIMSSPVMAVKTLSVKTWVRKCKHCGNQYDLEERDARMAPGVPLVVAETERPFAVANLDRWRSEPESAVCPCCGKTETYAKFGKGKIKKVELSLLVHPEWLKGVAKVDKQGRPYGGSSDDPVDNTIRWNDNRSKNCQLIEIRGKIPPTITLPDGTVMNTGKDAATSPANSRFVCRQCGTDQSILEASEALKVSHAVAFYAVQGYCPACHDSGAVYNGRFFAPATEANQLNAATLEWSTRREDDLSAFWPRSEIPFGDRTCIKDPLPKHGYHRWSHLFNPRQLLGHSLILKAIQSHFHSATSRDFVLGVFQQYLRNQCMFTIWNIAADKLEPMFSNNNFNPKSNTVENSFFANLGRGNWASQVQVLDKVLKWKEDPWELVSKAYLSNSAQFAANHIQGKSTKTFPNDSFSSTVQLESMSSSELNDWGDSSFDMIITDPPFGGLLQYSELADFFYVWLRLVLAKEYPDQFFPEYTPKALECVSNPTRHENSDVFYQRLLTACWAETSRMLRPGGLLTFTFHHSEDRPWVSVLESLFDAGFYLQATYPIRGDETKGDKAQFGSQKIEYDIIHVCRKRHQEPNPISWARLRRQVLRDVRELQDLLEHHQENGLPEADLQVIRRGKALEYFSRHYGKVYKDQDTPMNVLEALLGINQLLDEESSGIKEAPPHNAEPFTRMLLRLYDGVSELPRDQIQKFLRGTGSAPSDYVNRGWVYENKKVFYLTPPMELAQSWVGKQRKRMTSDYDQTMFLIGACFEGSGINASETLNNANFSPHPALGAILAWFKTHGADSPVRNAATLASQLYRNWESKNQPQVKQLLLFDNLGEEDT